jgi:hypothetical protein
MAVMDIVARDLRGHDMMVVAASYIAGPARRALYRARR